MFFISQWNQEQSHQGPLTFPNLDKTSEICCNFDLSGRFGAQNLSIVYFLINGLFADTWSALDTTHVVNYSSLFRIVLSVLHITTDVYYTRGHLPQGKEGVREYHPCTKPIVPVIWSFGSCGTVIK